MPLVTGLEFYAPFFAGNAYFLGAGCSVALPTVGLCPLVFPNLGLHRQAQAHQKDTTQQKQGILEHHLIPCKEVIIQKVHKTKKVVSG
jgi:hypothetical protein